MKLIKNTLFDKDLKYLRKLDVSMIRDKSISSDALRLYLILATTDEKKFNLNQTYLMNQLGIKRQKYQKIVKELVTAGYLITSGEQMKKRTYEIDVYR